MSKLQQNIPATLIAMLFKLLRTSRRPSGRQCNRVLFTIEYCDSFQNARNSRDCNPGGTARFGFDPCVVEMTTFEHRDSYSFFHEYH